MKRLLVLCLALGLSAAAWADEALWGKLREGGHVLLIRHAATEAGTGDPPGFKLEDCASQRNLSEAGREEARKLGRVLKWRAINVAEVRSSRWCRCLDTAQLAFGFAEPWEVLNSLYNDPGREARLVKEVAALAATVKPPRNVALVTHNFNIRALTGVSPATAEIIVVESEAGKLKLVGRLAP